MTQQVFTSRLRPVIRVFVSSTFSDMKHERNALAADAFPKLEQLCQRHRFQFQAIDLRFLLRQGFGGQGGVGERYGWGPAPFPRHIRSANAAHS